MKKGILKNILIITAVFIVVIIILGFLFPGMIWTKGLGVKYTEKDYNSFIDKLPYIKDLINNDAEDYIYGELVDMDISFTSEELTAFFNENKIFNSTLKNTQIKINSDNTVDIAAKANVDKFLDTFLNNKYTKEDIESRMPALGILPENVNIYLNLKVNIKNNKADFFINTATVQGINIPSNIIWNAKAINIINDGIDKLIEEASEESGAIFSRVYVENKKLKLIGKFPSSLEKIPN